MKKGNAVKMIEGGIIGAALGIAAALVLAPKSGKKFRGDVSKKAAEFQAYLAPRFKKMKDIGEEEYNNLVQKSIKTFAKAKRLTAEEGQDLVNHAKKSWEDIERIK